MAQEGDSPFSSHTAFRRLFTRLKSVCEGAAAGGGASEGTLGEARTPAVEKMLHTRDTTVPVFDSLNFRRERRENDQS